MFPTHLRGYECSNLLWVFGIYKQISGKKYQKNSATSAHRCTVALVHVSMMLPSIPKSTSRVDACSPSVWQIMLLKMKPLFNTHLCWSRCLLAWIINKNIDCTSKQCHIQGTSCTWIFIQKSNFWLSNLLNIKYLF